MRCVCGNVMKVKKFERESKEFPDLITHTIYVCDCGTVEKISVAQFGKVLPIGED